MVAIEVMVRAHLGHSLPLSVFNANPPLCIGRGAAALIAGVGSVLGGARQHPLSIRLSASPQRTLPVLWALGDRSPDSQEENHCTPQHSLSFLEIYAGAKYL